MKKQIIKGLYAKIRKSRAGKALFFLLVVPFLLFLLLNAFFPLPPMKDHSVIIRDHKGTMVHAFLTKDEKWRMKVEETDITPLLKKTLLEKEDRYFNYHFGVNPIAAGRAFFQNIFSGRRVSGASTITMQVAKMLDPAPRTWPHKLKEMFRALQLEWNYSKTEIFRLYCSLLPYGGNIEGIKSASLLYFGKEPDHLSLAEITTLSIVPNRPSAWKITPGNEILKTARNEWLLKLAESGLYKKEEIKDALSEPLDGYRRNVPRHIPHLARRLRHTGTNVHTTIMLNRQMQIEELVGAYIRSISHRNIRNAAVLVVDNQTGNVISYIGSADFFDTRDGGQVDGTVAIRQPGSTLKPFLYGLCMDQGLFTPKSVIHDVPVFYDGYAPENYDRRFNGEVSLEYALEHSLNVPAVKAMAALGKDKFINQLSSAGFRTVSKQKAGLGLSVALGGCGTSLEELTALFSAFAQEGSWRPLQYTRSNTTSPEKELLSPAASFMITDILSKVNRPDFPLHWETTAHLPKIAWKTGTSYGRRDGWSIGYNKKYTVGVWTGNFSGISAPDLSGAEIATPLLFRIFNAIDYNSSEEWYTPPKDVDIRTVCAETGMPPAPHCETLRSDYFIPLVSSNLPCNNRKEYMISENGKISYCMECVPENGFKKKFFRIVPASLQSYYDERGLAGDPIPPHNPDCEKLFRGNGPAIVSPRGGAEYFTSAENPDPIQLRCQTGNDVLKVHWYINNQYYKAAAAGERLYFTPTPGSHMISCTDDKGRSSSVRIEVLRY